MACGLRLSRTFLRMAPIAMLSGLWFHADDRRDLYSQYSQAVMPIIDQVGADILML